MNYRYDRIVNTEFIGSDIVLSYIVQQFKHTRDLVLEKIIKNCTGNEVVRQCDIERMKICSKMGNEEQELVLFDNECVGCIITKIFGNKITIIFDPEIRIF